MRWSNIKRLLFLLKYKGIKWTYNYLHFRTFYGTGSACRIKLLHWLAPYPSYIEIEVTTRCNIKCIICEHTYWNEESRDMSFESFKKVVDQFPKLKWIGLTGIGESFINKDFMKMLRYVKSKSIYAELYDSFYFIDERIAKELIEMGVDRIFASIDGATKETYEKIRDGSNFERVINNVRNLIRLKKEMNAYYPELDFHYIITKTNIHEIPQYIELVYSLNSENSKIQFTRMIYKFKEVDDLFIEVPKEAVEKAERKALELGVRLGWNANIPQVKPPITQCTAWIMPFIFVTGDVIPCCAGNEANRREFQKKYSLGNIFKKSFKEIWNGEKYREFRRMISKGEVPMQCKNCCIFDMGGRK